MAKVSIYTEGIRLDLFKDEGINIKSKVQDINDISKVFSDFTKGFNVPASKVNNKYFKHYYNADITGGFDARTKKDAKIYINDVFFREGGIRLTSTSLKENQIFNYNIQFEGDTIRIKDLLGDDKLDSLDFSDLDHAYDDTNVSSGLQGTLMSGKVIYPFIGYRRRFLYASNQIDTSDDTVVNLHYDPASVIDGVTWADFKPAITVGTIFEKIAIKYPTLLMSGDIFDRAYLRDLWLFLNKDEGNLVTTGSETKTIIDWSTGGNTWIDFPTDTLTFTSVVPTTAFGIIINVVVPLAFAGVEYKIVVEDAGTVIAQTNFITGSGSLVSSFQVTTGGLDLDLKCYIISNNILSALVSITQIEEDTTLGVYNTEVTFNGAGQLINPVIDMSYQMPDIKIIDFITGLVKMFNLTITSEDGVLNFISLDEWYQLGSTIDVKKFSNIENTSISRGKLKNEFVFKYENPETLLAEKFSKNTGVPYGNLEAKIYDDAGDLLDGSKLEIKVPFENMVYERLNDLGTGIQTDIQYGFMVDKSQEAIVTKPMFFYNNNVDVSATPIAFRDRYFAQGILNNINVPNTCLSLTDNTQQTLNFGAEFSTYNFGIMTQSLYKLGYEDYVTDMFSAQRRVYSYKARLSAQLLSSIKLNDRLIIGNKKYIINSFDLNLITGLTKFELLNDIYTAGELIGDSFTISRYAAIIPITGSLMDILVTSADTVTITIIDTGDGIFVTSNKATTINIETVELTTPVNSGTSPRSQTVRFTKGVDVLDLIITQKGLSVSFDNDVVTFDSDTITWDNI